MVQVELWALLTFGVGLLIAFFGGVAGIAKFILMQMDKRLDERFKAQEKARDEEQVRRSEQFSGIEGQLTKQEAAQESNKQHWDLRFSDLDRLVADHRERIGRLEATAEASPTHEHLSDLHERINGIADDVSGLSGEFKGARHTLELIHSFLLNGGKT